MRNNLLTVGIPELDGSQELTGAHFLIPTSTPSAHALLAFGASIQEFLSGAGLQCAHLCLPGFSTGPG